MSSMSCTCAFALRMMTSSARVTASPRSSPVRSMRAQPYTAFSGVRSSWESTARNSSFARLAASAAARARCSSVEQPRVVDGDGELGRHAGHDGLQALGEHAGLLVSEEESRR